MELGANLCKPRQPACHLCPVRKHCRACQEERIQTIPNLAPRAAATPRHFIAFVIAAGDYFLVRQRSSGGINARLWEFPNLEVPVHSPGVAALAAVCLDFRPDRLEPFCDFKHTITRYRIRLEAFYGEIPQRVPARTAEARWHRLMPLDKLAFSSAHRKIVEALKTKLRS